jgi:hypothetical protein
MPSLDLSSLVRTLANRDAPKTEATVQSTIHAFLLAAPLQLGEGDLETIELEAQAGGGRRIDVEVGSTVIEVKKDLRAGTVAQDGRVQLEGYVTARTAATGGRYIGILTDGADWRAYQLVNGTLVEATRYTLTTGSDPIALATWLDGALATVDQIAPTPRAIVARLGATTSAHALDLVALRGLYTGGGARPSVALKRQLWAKLVTAALGSNFQDTDELFLEHTLLVVTAEVIAHAVIGIDINTQAPASLLSGEVFRSAQVAGVVEHDFFDWVLEVPGGEAWVTAIARRLARFDWTAVEHDVLKVLYESVIGADQRKRMGEYYTPDWLAQRVIDEVVTDPLNQRVLDPACGSGTFLFHAIRRHLTAADAAGMDLPAAINSVTEHVLGLEVHPVAVAFARVTYLLAIGTARMAAPNRPAMVVPVYLGDSLQRGQHSTLFSATALTVKTADGAQLFDDLLRFPERTMTDVGRFDQLVEELSRMATSRERGAPVPGLGGVVTRYGIHPDDQTMLAQTFAVMCRLHDDDRDHIWGYYVRNLARPAWLARDANRVDALVGNPPWLAYRFMTAGQQDDFRTMSTDRALWAGASVATNQDLAGLFLVRAAELYLKPGGSFGMVMPEAMLTRTQHAGFRAADFGTVRLNFDQGWTLHGVRPSFFPVPGSVITGTRSTTAKALPGPTHNVTGRLPGINVTWDVAEDRLTLNTTSTAAPTGTASTYAPRFAQGATIVPRVLFYVTDTSATAPLGTAGRMQVTSHRNSFEKRPWKDLPDLTGTVERQFVRNVHTGHSVIPFQLMDPQQAVIPHDGTHLMAATDERLDRYPGLAQWWRAADAQWMANRSSDRLTLTERLDYRRGLTMQMGAAPHRVVYSASGVHLAAARLSDPHAIVEHKLYWAATSTIEEARYLTAVLNAPALSDLVRPLQGRGEHNPRDFDKYVWQLPIPMFDATIPEHMQLVQLAEQAEDFVAGLTLPDRRFETQRRYVRDQFVTTELGTDINDAVTQLLDTTP